MQDTPAESIKKRPRFTKVQIAVLFVLVVLVLLLMFINSTGKNTEQVFIHVSKNETITTIENELVDKQVISSVFSVKLFFHALSTKGTVARGDYKFNPHESAFGVAWQLAKGDHQVAPVRVVLKEGETNAQFAATLVQLLPDFPKDQFLNTVTHMQGYLFPDTYFFYPLSTSDEVVDTITTNFNTRIHPFLGDIASSGKTQRDIIIMASIVQKEAHGKDDASTIAGILWKRIALGMPLQVDAAPTTYKEKGLPVGPIGNPGLLAIQASISPTTSPYLFYLHDKNGMVHWAKDFAEHKRNIAHYLK